MSQLSRSGESDVASGWVFERRYSRIALVAAVIAVPTWSMFSAFGGPRVKEWGSIMVGVALLGALVVWLWFRWPRRWLLWFGLVVQVVLLLPVMWSVVFYQFMAARLAQAASITALILGILAMCHHEFTLNSSARGNPNDTDKTVFGNETEPEINWNVGLNFSCLGLIMTVIAFPAWVMAWVTGGLGLGGPVLTDVALVAMVFLWSWCRWPRRVSFWSGPVVFLALLLPVLWSVVSHDNFVARVAQVVSLLALLSVAMMWDHYDGENPYPNDGKRQKTRVIIFSREGQHELNHRLGREFICLAMAMAMVALPAWAVAWRTGGVGMWWGLTMMGMNLFTVLFGWLWCRWPWISFWVGLLFFCVSIQALLASFSYRSMIMRVAQTMSMTSLIMVLMMGVTPLVEWLGERQRAAEHRKSRMIDWDQGTIPEVDADGPLPKQ